MNLFAELEKDFNNLEPQMLFEKGNAFTKDRYTPLGVAKKDYKTAAQYFLLADKKCLNEFNVHHDEARKALYDLKRDHGIQIEGFDQPLNSFLQEKKQEVTYCVNNTSTFNNNILNLDISDEDLPNVIGEQVSGLKELKRSVDDATRNAETAKKSAETASYWKHNSYFFGFIETKDIEGTIENVQKALQDLTKAQQSAAQAQKVSYQNQEKIGQITRYLFALGASNIAANRSVVNRLKQELEGASASELNEMAKQEIIAVIRQLKAQEDLLNRQNKQGETLREHDDHFKQIDDDIKIISEKQSNSLTKEEHNNDLKEYIEKLEGLKSLISDTEKGLLDKIGNRQTIENAKQEKQAFINAAKEQKQAIQGFDTKLTETAAEQKKALAEEVQNRNEK